MTTTEQYEVKSTDGPTNPEFEVHMLSDEGKVKAHAIARTFDACLNRLTTLCPQGRHFNIVRTKLEEAAFFAKKAMASETKNQPDSSPGMENPAH
jgi:hypothetical protein